MTINSEDVVCRFIRPHKKYWDKDEGRPKQRAFYDKNGLSLWHEIRLAQHGVSFDDLLFGTLEGHGQAHHTIGEYFHFAQKAAQKNWDDPEFSIDIDWRPGPDSVDPPRRQWKDAHLEVDISNISSPAYLQFRQFLAANTRCTVAPDVSW